MFVRFLVEDAVSIFVELTALYIHVFQIGSAGRKLA